MTVSPENGTVLCEAADAAKTAVDAGGVSYEEERLPTYRVVTSPPGFWCAPGDEIVCDSTGTRLNVPGKGVQYLFRAENIACKVL